MKISIPLNKLDAILFELIQIAIGTRKELTSQLTAEEWASLRLEFKKQALLGIGYCGIVRLPQEQTPPIQVLAQWVHNAEKIRKKNERITGECVELCKRLEHDGFDTCILKGQSNLINYQTANDVSFLNTNCTNLANLADYRTPGDIDVLMRSKEEPGAIDLPIRYCITQCRLHDEPVGKICYHHMDMPQTLSGSPLKGESNNSPTPVEAHYRACWLSSPLRNRRLQKWLEVNMPFGQVTSPEGFPIPSNSYNAIFQLIHIYKHLFEEGIGLRQLLDYYFVLRALHIEQETLSGSPFHSLRPCSGQANSGQVTGESPDHWNSMGMWAESIGRGVLSNVEIMHHLKRFGLDKFAAAVMYVLKEAFNMPAVYLICEPNKDEGIWLLNEIMLAGNFGRSDERNEGKGHIRTKLSRALMLVKHYPHEALWQPWFMVYHWLWRRFEWWKILN